MPRSSSLTNAELRRMRPGRKVHGRFFMLTRSPLFPPRPKCAVVVSKKVAVKAVKRNRIKRQGRSILATLLSELGSGAHVFTAKREAASASFAQMEADIRELVRKGNS